MKATSKAAPKSHPRNAGNGSLHKHRKQVEENLRDDQAILATIEEVAEIGSWHWDLLTQKVTWSDGMFHLFGVKREGFDGDVNRVVAERIHPDDAAAVTESNRKVLEETNPIPMSYRIVLPDGTERTVWAQGKLVRDETGKAVALTGYVQDITESVRAEKKILQLKRLYAALSQVNQMIVRVREREELFQTICDVAVKFGEFSLAWVGMLDDNSGKVKPVAANGLDIKQWPFPVINIHQEEYKDSLTPVAIRTSKVTISENIQTDVRLQGLSSQFRSHPYHASAVIPIRLRNKTIGILALVSQEKGLFKDEDEIRLLEEMSLDISFALDNMEKEKERKQAEEALKETEERFSTAFFTSPLSQSIITQRTSEIMAVNDACCRLFGYRPEELIGASTAKLNLWENPTNRLSAVEELQRTGRLLPQETNIRVKSGEIRTVIVEIAPISWKGIPCLISSVFDITERKRAEDALKESEERYRGLFDHMAEGYAYCQMLFENGVAQDWIYCDVNEAFETLTGLKNAKGKRVSEIIPGIRETDPELFGIYSRVALTGRHEKFEMFVQALQQWFSVSVYSPQKEFFVAIFDLVTERKQAEEALKRNEHVLRLFVEHSPASIAMFDRDMKYIVASQRYLIDYDLPPQDLTGRSHYEVFPEIPERWKEIHRRCLQGAIEKADEDPFPRLSGKLDWVRWEIRPWYEETGKIGGIILFSEVITERKRVQDELRVLNLELEQRVLERTMQLSEANRAKDEFLANMSHELRTPLNTVLGLSESLLEQRRGSLNEKQIQSIELIASSGKHLLGLINDILEISKIEAGKLQLNPSMVSVRELCESSLNFIKELAVKKLITVEFNDEASISSLHADPQRIKQILINLLTNAVKFTPERGRVSLQVYSNAENNQILFSVADNGIGIAPQDLEKLFTPFTQLDSSLARQYPGTGLGLALVQKLTEMHGGSVQVESEIGKGSRFTIVLPFSRNVEVRASSDGAKEVSSSEQETTFSSTTPGKRGVVLLAEDNQINSEMLADYLEEQGYRVTSAVNGEEVLEKAGQVAPDIILMDIQMPKMDGLEATRRLRADPRFRSTPIIALTALVMPGDKERCLEAGANEYMSKPVSLKMLARRIESFLGTEDRSGKNEEH